MSSNASIINIDELDLAFYINETASDWHFTLLYSYDENGIEERKLKLYGRMKLSKTFSGSRTYNFDDKRNCDDTNENEIIRIHNVRHDNAMQINTNACLEFVKHINIHSFASSEDEKKVFSSIILPQKVKTTFSNSLFTSNPVTL